MTPLIPGKDGGGKDFFLNTQRPKDLERRSYPRWRPRLLNSLMSASQPMGHPGDGLAEKGKSQLDKVQAA